VTNRTLAGLAVALIGLVPFSSLLGQGQPASLEGFWLSDGYGYLLEIDAKRMQAFEVTAISCLPAWTAVRVPGPVDGAPAVFKLAGGSARVEISTGPSPGTVYVARPAAASKIVCWRLDGRPKIRDQKTDNTPLGNFDIFWTTFAEHYPFFALHHIDWDAVRAKYRSKITADTKPKELFAALEEMIEPLHDAHTSLFMPSLAKRYHGMRPDPHPLDKKDFGRITGIIKKHLQGELKSVCQGQVSFGKLSDTVGYLRVQAFAGYVPGNDFDKGAEKLEVALDEALRDAHQWRGLIVDVRVNGGGSDVYGVMAASRLSGREYLAFTKKARNDPKSPALFTPPQTTMVKVGRAPRLEGNVVLLTSRHSVSAAETFTMALMGRTPRVTRVGENTQGVFSDVLGRRLPNGWRFGLPNEIFLTESGEAFDGPGIAPDIAVPVFTRDDLDHGRDPALQKALEILMRATGS
jgi:C-terminal processing protease CtpA/Prc